MKKGLILTLMVVLVAFAAFVNANAPTIGTLNDIIVGTNEDVSGSNKLMKYNDAVDISGKVTWNNPTYTYDKFRVYLYNNYQTPGAGQTQAAAYNQAGLTTPLLTSEFNLVDNGGTNNASALTHNGLTSTSGQFSMGLLDYVLHPALSMPYQASAAVNGIPIAAGYDKAASVTLVAGVTSGTQGLITAQKSFQVLCKEGQPDGGGNNIVYNFTTGVNGWIYVAQPAAATGQAASFGPGANGVGFNLAAVPASTYAYSLWKSPYDAVAHPTGGAAAWKAVASLNTDQTIDRCMGYRFTFNNAGWSHYGSMIVLRASSKDDFSNPSFPSSTTPLEVRIYWEPPLTLGLMEDGGAHATNAWGAVDGNNGYNGDLRAYALTFDAIASPAYTNPTYAGDIGRLAMTQLELAPYNPPAGTIVMDWGSAKVLTPSASVRAFNAASNWRDVSSAVGGSNVGTAVIGANTMTMVLADGANAFCYASTVADDTYTGTNALNAVSNNLYSFAMEVSVASQATCPIYRLGVYNVYATNAGAFTSYTRRAGWEEVWGNGLAVFIGKSPYFNPIAPTQILPCAPSTNANAPSVIRSFVYSHNQVTPVAPATCTLIPTVSLVETYWGGAAGYAGTLHTTPFINGGGWAFPNAVLTYGYIAWKDLGNGN